MSKKHLETGLRLASLSAAAAGVVMSPQANAAGVAAGTLIENTATATYSSDGSSGSVDSNTVSITVDELLDVAVSSQDAGSVPLSSGGAVLSFQIKNSGNGPEAFDLAVDASLTGDDFDPAVTQIAYDSNNNGVYDAGVDTVVPTGGSTPSIAAEGTLLVFIVSSIADSPADGDLGDVQLTATAATGSGTAGTVFAGQGEGGVDAVVGTSTATSDAQGTYLAQVGSVTLSKSAAIADQFGGTEPVPGATVTYSLVASVSGSGSVAGLAVTDAIPTGTTYVASSLTLDTAGLTDASGDDAGEASASGISVDLGTVDGGDSHTITFKVTID